MSDMLIAFSSRVTARVESRRADDVMCFDLSWVFATALIFSEGSYGREILVNLLPCGWCKEVPRGCRRGSGTTKGRNSYL